MYLAKGRISLSQDPKNDNNMQFGRYSINRARFPTHSIGAGRCGHLGRASAERRVHTTVQIFSIIDSKQNDARTSGPCLCRNCQLTILSARPRTPIRCRNCKGPRPLPLPNLLTRETALGKTSLGSYLCRRYQLTKRRTSPHSPLRHGTTRAPWPVCLWKLTLINHTTVYEALLLDSDKNDAGISGPCLCHRC